MFSSGRTMMLNEVLSHTDNLEDLRDEIYSKLEDQKTKWAKEVNNIIEENGYSKTEFAKKCEVSKATITKWCNGSLPQSREAFIRIGFAAHYDLKSMNRFLQRYGRYNELYPKSPEDSIYIFVLNSDEIDHTYNACLTVQKEINEYVSPQNESAKVENYNSELILDYLLSIKGKEELAEFIKNNESMFNTSFNNFYDYVIEFVRKNNESYMDNNNADNVYILAETLGWSSSLRKCVYSIYKREWFPLRNKVISLGIHLNMNIDEINKLLKLAKMEPLYIINPLECVIMYALLEAELDEDIYDGTDDLYNHVVGVMSEMGIADDEYELSDF